MDFDRLLAAGAVDFVQPSVAQMGGISELCKVFPVAALRHVTLMPHCFYDGPGLLAAIRATAVLGTTDAMIEWRYFDLEAQLYGSALAPVIGRIPVPKRPGPGLDPDSNVIRDYLRPQTDSRAQWA
jgi:L-alanine-DL-glutamate epimerase-like enolase superfamily enzyme